MAVVIQKSNFNNRSTGSYNYTQFAEDIGSGSSGGAGWGLGHAAIVYDPTKGNVMRLEFPAGVYSTSPNGGFDSTVNLPDADHEELWIRYYLKLGDETHPFDAKWGGKLGGLVYKDFTGAGSLPDGTDGGYDYFGFSGNDDDNPDYLELVIYHQNAADSYGDRWGLSSPTTGNTPTQYDRPSEGDDILTLGTDIPLGTWFELKARIKMNTAGVADGIYQVWIDDLLTVDIDNLVFRNSGQTWGVRDWDLSFFYGGATIDFAPDADQYIYFSDFLVKTTEITEEGYVESSPTVNKKIKGRNGKIYIANNKLLY